MAFIAGGDRAPKASTRASKPCWEREPSTVGGGVAKNEGQPHGPTRQLMNAAPAPQPRANARASNAEPRRCEVGRRVAFTELSGERLRPRLIEHGRFTQDAMNFDPYVRSYAQRTEDDLACINVIVAWAQNERIATEQEDVQDTLRAFRAPWTDPHLSLQSV